MLKPKWMFLSVTPPMTTLLPLDVPGTAPKSPPISWSTVDATVFPMKSPNRWW